MKTTDNQEELFVVVDQNDNIVGHKSRYECHHDNTIIHRGTDVFIFDDRGRVLLQKRSMTKDTHPGYWTSSTGGHVMGGETYKQAIEREIKEEIGVSLPVAFKAKFIFSYPYETEMEALFTAKSNGPFYPKKEEVDEVRFFHPEELKKRVVEGSIQLTPLAMHELKLLKVLP